MSEITPISREELRKMKAEHDEKGRQEMEKRRLKQVEAIIAKVYSSVMYAAKNKKDTSYGYPIKSDEKEFLLTKDNMNDVIKGLQAAFPDCSVKYVEYGRGLDGKLRDMRDTYAMCSEFAISQLNRMSLELHIIVDWS